MAAQHDAPYVPQDVHEVSVMIKGLESCAKKHGGGKKTPSSKKSTFKILEAEKLTVDSWKFAEWDYKQRDLPTYARGLFTYNRQDGTPEIAVRGYDKFFNVGEVNETNWQNVEERTKGPYELSVKENGCIIFIGGLEGDRLLVCSKHSTGARQDADLSHAVAGERWIEKHLGAVGKTKIELARELRKRNATAVAELCDDTFEEHVLAYDQQSAGLYLHGINLNLPEFATYPSELVHKFADEWGFKKAEYLIKDDLETVKTFLAGCAETGSWNGRDTEGFVIRCQRKQGGNDGVYQDWFFKYKFEEPYLMYRQWREATKAIISGRVPRFKKHKQITEEYLLYARRQLAKDPQLGKAYNANHGIIAMRDGFLNDRGLKGSDIIRQEEANGDGSSDEVTHNVVLVPIASIGCGKTTVAIALTKLFGWGHVQNDNITGKSNRPKQFATLVCNSLAAHPAMVADRNNHQKREREQIINDVSQVIPSARFVALHYVHDPKPEMLPMIRKITQERVLARGDNHQTIQAGSKSSTEIIGIMEGFLSRFEPINPQAAPDDGFDEIIDLDVACSSRENLETVVKSLHSAYPKLFAEIPSEEDLDAAIDAALKDYQPDIKHDLSFRSSKSKPQNRNNTPSQPNGSTLPAKAPKLEYFCIKFLSSDILSILDKTFPASNPNLSKFYRQLQGTRRVQSSFHVTLMHRASIPSHPDLWAHLSSLHSQAFSSLRADRNLNSQLPTQDPVLGECRVRLERVVWDNRVMCIVVRLLNGGWESANSVSHVTVGTAGAEIKPKESNELLERWIEGESGGKIMDVEVGGNVEVIGSVRAVMQGQGR